MKVLVFDHSNNVVFFEREHRWFTGLDVSDCPHVLYAGLLVLDDKLLHEVTNLQGLCESEKKEESEMSVD